MYHFAGGREIAGRLLDRAAVVSALTPPPSFPSEARVNADWSGGRCFSLSNCVNVLCADPEDAVGDAAFQSAQTLK